MATGQLKSADPRDELIRVDATGLDPNQARSRLLKEREKIATLQPPKDNYLAARINAADLKIRLRDIETDYRDRLHVAPPNRGSFNSTSMALPRRWRSRPQHQKETFAYVTIGGLIIFVIALTFSARYGASAAGAELNDFAQIAEM